MGGGPSATRCRFPMNENSHPLISHKRVHELEKNSSAKFRVESIATQVQITPSHYSIPVGLIEFSIGGSCSLASYITVHNLRDLSTEPDTISPSRKSQQCTAALCPTNEVIGSRECRTSHTLRVLSIEQLTKRLP